MNKELPEARPYYMQALHILETMLGVNHPTTTELRNQLARLDAEIAALDEST